MISAAESDSGVAEDAETSAPILSHVYRRCREFWLGVRRGKGEYPLWSLTDGQPSSRPKSAPPFGLGRRRRRVALVPPRWIPATEWYAGGRAASGAGGSFPVSGCLPLCNSIESFTAAYARVVSSS